MSFAALTKKAISISPPYKARIAEDNAFWQGSEFDWIRHLPSRTRGKIGQDFARSVFEDCGYSPKKRKNSFEVNGLIVLSRTSMLWDLTDWKFQQVRNTTFDYLFCLGLCPDSASAWMIPKDELYNANGDLQERQGWDHQHGGRAGKEDAWLVMNAKKAPDWLAPYGGDIARICNSLKLTVG